MLDALRQDPGASLGPETVPRRRSPSDAAILASLGYSSTRPDEPARLRHVVSIVLGVIAVIAAGMVVWQVAAMSNLLPNPPWRPAAPTLAPLAGRPQAAPPPGKGVRTSVTLTRPSPTAPRPAAAAVGPGVPFPSRTSESAERKVTRTAGPAFMAVTTASSRASNPTAPPEQVEKPHARASTVLPSGPVAEPPAPTPAASKAAHPVPDPAGGSTRPTQAAPSSGKAAPLSGERTPSLFDTGATAAAPASGGPSPITRPPDAGTDHFKLALYYQRVGDFENALIHYRAVLEANELNAEAHNNLGLLYQDKGLYEEAVRECRRATFIDPGSTTARNNLGVALLKSGNAEGAITEFTGIVAAEPGNVQVLANLALAQKTSGHAEQARETLQRALSIDGRSAVAHYNMALILEEYGELARAVEHYEQFLALSGAEHAALAGEVRGRVKALRAKLIQGQ